MGIQWSFQYKFQSYSFQWKWKIQQIAQFSVLKFFIQFDTVKTFLAENLSIFSTIFNQI